jgi:hypothetical protein
VKWRVSKPGDSSRRLGEPGYEMEIDQLIGDVARQMTDVPNTSGLRATS